LNSLGVDWATHWLSQNLSSGSGPNLVYSKLANTEMAQLTLLINDHKASLRANPQVTANDGMTAELEVGQENYFNILTTSGGYTYGTLEDISSGILLRITPHILLDEDEVDVQVEPQVRDVSAQGANGFPVITFRRASTDVRVKNGQSVIIGGLVNTTTTKVVNKIPVFGDIPLFGPLLFRHRSNEKIKTEDVIIITPHILANLTPATDVQSPDLKHLIPEGSDEMNSKNKQ
jgi:type II secretory pathway component GspD/PulD (secretin)